MPLKKLATVFNMDKRKKPSFSSKRPSKKSKTATDAASIIEYIESEYEVEVEAEDVSVLSQQLKSPSPLPIFIRGKTYYRATDLASKSKKKEKTSHIWWKDHGFEIVETEHQTRHYYCCECLDRKRDPTYSLLVISGISNITLYWKMKHNIDKDGLVVKKLGSIDQEVKKLSDSILDIIFNVDFTTFKLLLIQWLVYCHIAFRQIENQFF